MENMTMNPVIPANASAWQLTLSASLGTATSALATLEVQGIATRPATTLVAPCAAVATDAAKRERAFTGKGHRGVFAIVPGSPAWSPPI